MSKKYTTHRKARVLSDCSHGRCGDVVSFDARAAELLQLDTDLDFHPDAVAAAEAELAARSSINAAT